MNISMKDKTDFIINDFIMYSLASIYFIFKFAYSKEFQSFINAF